MLYKDSSKCTLIIYYNQTYRLWNVTEDSDAERFQYYYGFIEQVADVSFRTNLQNFWKYQSDNTVGDIDLLDMARRVHPNVTLAVSLSHTNKEVGLFKI